MLVPILLKLIDEKHLNISGAWDFPGTKDELEEAVKEGKIPGNEGCRGYMTFITPPDVELLVALGGPYIIIDEADNCTPVLHIK